jgi:hypothetical protein
MGIQKLLWQPGEQTFLKMFILFPVVKDQIKILPI